MPTPMTTGIALLGGLMSTTSFCVSGCFSGCFSVGGYLGLFSGFLGVLLGLIIRFDGIFATLS